MQLVPGSAVSVLKGKMETFIKEELIITMIKLDEMEIFLKNRFQVCKMVLAEFLKQCKARKRIPNSTETFMILKLYTQIVEGVLHKKDHLTFEKSASTIWDIVTMHFSYRFCNSDT